MDGFQRALNESVQAIAWLVLALVVVVGIVAYMLGRAVG